MNSYLLQVVTIGLILGCRGYEQASSSSVMSCCVSRDKRPVRRSLGVGGYVPSSHVRRSPTCETVRSPSPELNREYYLPPDKVTWRKLTEEELKENNRKVTKTFYLKGTERLEGPRICTRGDMARMDGGGLYVKEGEESPTTGYRTASLSSISSSSSDSSDGQDMDEPRPMLTLCDRMRLSLAGICRGSRWTWTTASTGHIPLALPGVALAKPGPSPVQRQLSFVDDEQPGLSHRSTVVETRKRSRSIRPTSPTKKQRQERTPYRHASSSTSMLES